MNHLPEPIEKILTYFRKFSGVGRKTAERYCFELLDWKKEEILSFSQMLIHFTEQIQRCTICNCLIEKICPFCNNPRRDSSVLCILSSARDVYFFEETNM